LPFEQLLQQHHGFRPERADMFFSTLTGQVYAAWTFEANRIGAQVERFLYSRAAVVEEREQGVIAHTFECRTIRLSQDRRHFRRVQIAWFRNRSALYRDVEYFDALGDRSGIPGRNEVQEAAYRCKPAVARADRAATFVFGVTKERNKLSGGQLGQRDHRHLLA
jgi:hypothetical protein